MTMHSDGRLLELFAAIAGWEAPGLTPAAALCTGDPLKVMKSFVTFPKPTDLQTLQYPFTCHGCDTSTYQEQSASNIDEVIDQEEHVIWTALMFASQGDPLWLLSEYDAFWREAYRDEFLMHLRLRDPLNPTIVRASSMFLLRAEPTDFGLFNIPSIGIKFSTRVRTRLIRSTAF